MFVLIMLYIYYYDIVIIKGLHGFLFELIGIITAAIIIKIFFLIPMQYVDFMVLKRFFFCLRNGSNLNFIVKFNWIDFNEFDNKLKSDWIINNLLEILQHDWFGI